MATDYMRIDGLDEIAGAATIGEIAGKKGFFVIDSMDWSAVRGVSVDVGNANSADKGIVALSDLNITREADGATPYLKTFLFAPGSEGRTVEIIMTKSARDGTGAVPYLILTLDKARIARYGLRSNGEDNLLEEFSLTYTAISAVYYTEDAGGKIQKGATVKYDATSASLVSKADLNQATA